jgi:hypothetical protein
MTALTLVTDYVRQGVLQVTGAGSGVTRVITHGLNVRFLISDDDLVLRKLTVSSPS